MPTKAGLVNEEKQALAYFKLWKATDAARLLKNPSSNYDDWI